MIQYGHMNETNPANSAPRSGSSFAIPAAIIIGFGLIALSIYLSAGKTSENMLGGPNQEAPTEANLASIGPVTEDDHIRGNPNAPILIVEYCDFDCPFCKSFLSTMEPIMDEYGP